MKFKYTLLVLTPPGTEVPGPTGFSPLPTIRQSVSAKTTQKATQKTKQKATQKATQKAHNTNP